MQSIFDNEEFDKLKSADTIYLVYNESKQIQNLSINQIKNRGIATYSFLFSDGKSLIVRKDNQKKIVVSKQFLKDKDLLDLNIINKYRFEAMADLLFKKKAIYFIDKKELCKMNKIVLNTATLFCHP